MTSQEDDVLLVLQAQSGDTVAFEKLLRRLHAPLRKYVRSLAGESSTDDILQDVSWQIYRQIRQLREPRVLGSWVFRIATRISFRYLKRQKRWRDLENDPDFLRSIPVHTPLQPEKAFFRSNSSRMASFYRARVRWSSKVATAKRKRRDAIAPPEYRLR